MIRDYALAASGLLAEKIGGPSVKPYQPAGVWEAVAMLGSNTRDYKRDAGDGLYRRSMYTFWKRAAPPASMDIFNAPSREVCTVRRERTNTPLQALVTLNDPQFVEAARHLAQRTLAEAPKRAMPGWNSWPAVFWRVRLRPPRRRSSEASLDRLVGYYQSTPRSAKLRVGGRVAARRVVAPELLAGWTMLANQLMNLDEVLCTSKRPRATSPCEVRQGMQTPFNEETP